MATEEVIANIALVVAEESFASIACTDLAFLAGLLNKLECTFELFVRKLQHRVVGSPSHREDGKQSPLFQSDADEKIADSRELVVVFPVHTSYYIKGNRIRATNHFNSL